jgi:hypothetical protein
MCLVIRRCEPKEDRQHNDQKKNNDLQEKLGDFKGVIRRCEPKVVLLGFTSSNYPFGIFKLFL